MRKIQSSGFINIEINKHGVEASTTKSSILHDNSSAFSSIAVQLHELLLQVPSDYQILAKVAGMVSLATKRLILAIGPVLFVLLFVYSLEFHPFTPVDGFVLSSYSWYLVAIIIMAVIGRIPRVLRHGSGYHKILPFIAAGRAVVSWLIAHACLHYINGAFDSSAEEIHRSRLLQLIRKLSKHSSN